MDFYELDDALRKINEYSEEGVYCENEHHKRWYLYKIACCLGLDCSDMETGIEP